MSLLRCLRYLSVAGLASARPNTNRILSSVPLRPEHQLLKLRPDQFNFNQINLEQRRFKRFPTVKRRKTHKRSWWQKKVTRRNHNRMLSVSNQEFLQQHIKDHYSSPLNNVQVDGKPWTPQSKRTGLIARKIGVIPAWLKSGERILTTLLQVVDNHVISSFDVEQTKRNALHQNRWFTKDYATISVGAESGDVTKFTKEYCGLFAKAGIQPKLKISKFVITEDAMLPPGTPLYAQHFKVGQFVDVFGKTIDHGFEGVVRRWGFKGDGPKHHGATKFHRRPGSIGQSRKAGGPMKGRRMAGHMGDERKTMRSLQVMRINTKHNVIYVRGHSTPGSTGGWVYIFDAMCEGRGFDPLNPPPFPTFVPNENEQVPENLYHPDLFAMESETITYPKVEEVKRRTGAKLAKIRKK